MKIVCLDVEGVLTPEIWIEFARVSGIPALWRTTREEPDYDKLMAWRCQILKEHGLGLREVQAVIEQIDPLPGALAFLDALREKTEVILLSDTFREFARPLMKKLNYPTLFCNSLEVAPNGEILRHVMRIKNSKLATVKALQSIGFEVVSVGDSYNDIDMLLHSQAGILFRTTAEIRARYPQLPALESYGELLSAIEGAL